MSAVTVTPETREWCVKRSHPWVTYNPLLNRSYCRCGERQDVGEQPMDWDAKWAVFHDHPRGAPCRCYLPTAETQDWNRAVSDHIIRRDDGWDMTRIITVFTDGVVVAWSVDRRGWLDVVSAP